LGPPVHASQRLLDQEADLTLRHCTTHVEWHRRHVWLAVQLLQGEVANLGAVAVGEHE
jgi:predicted Rdx family selenoprotein